MMKKTVDVTKEIIDNIKKLDLECEAEQSKACLKLENTASDSSTPCLKITTRLTPGR